MGDGLLVAFASARRGVTCATDIQKALEAHNRRQPDRQLGVRIGLHAGDAIEEGGDLFGAAVSAAVRIADKAKGGEIVVSETVKQLAGTIPGVSFRDRGRHRPPAAQGRAARRPAGRGRWAGR